MSTNTETIEDDRIVAKCYVELGNVTKEKGEYDESLRYHRKSLEIFERIDDALSVADSHLNIAEIYKAKGELKRAMSEYEKGLTLYEDVYVDDANKNSDSGTDVSLNSSSFSDLQHTKLISKSDGILPQTTLINTNQKDISHSSLHLLNDVMNTSTKKINEFNGVSQSIDDSCLISSEKLTSERRKSPSTSSISDLQYINANDMFLPLSPVEFVYQTTGETTPDESDILEIDLLSLHSIKQDYSKLIAEPSSLDKNLEDTNNNNNDKSINILKDTIANNQKQINKTSQLWHHLPNKQFLIIILSIFLTGVLCWSLNSTSIQSLLSYSSIDAHLYEKSDTHDLSEQLRKILTWRKDRLTSLNKDNRRIIKEFLTNSDSRMEMTLDQFQQILDMLNLRIVLIPQ